MDGRNGDDVGLRDVARWLTTPAACGVYLSVRDLQRVGAGVGIEGVPSSRRLAVEHLFRVAALDENVAGVIDALVVEISEHIASYDACDSPSLDRWVSMASASLDRLAEMRQASTG